MGYGVCLNKAEARIELNRFDYNRHSIAATGRTPSGYEAANNVELGASLGHCFDMHGGRDRKDGTQIAGTWMKIHHNTFRAPQTPVVIRGTPAKKAEIEHNWFPHHGRKSPPAVVHSKNTVIRNNHYGK